MTLAVWGILRELYDLCSASVPLQVRSLACTGALFGRMSLLTIQGSVLSKDVSPTQNIPVLSKEYLKFYFSTSIFSIYKHKMIAKTIIFLLYPHFGHVRLFVSPCIVLMCGIILVSSFVVLKVEEIVFS